MNWLRRVSLVTVCLLCLGIVAQAYFEFNGGPDNERDDLGYYYAMTGGLFPTGPVPNGNNGSGGTFRYIFDDPSWYSPAGLLTHPLDQWNKDDWFPENAGLAITLVDQGTVIYDNNGIEDGSGVWFYDYEDLPETADWKKKVPGLYGGYCMSNNWDWIYAGYIRLAEPAVVDTIIGYFDPRYGFDPMSVEIGYRVNIWSSFQDMPARPTSYMPSLNSFTGDVLSSDNVAGTFSVSDTGVDRIFPSWYRDSVGNPVPPDDIWRLTFKLAEPIALPAGVYFIGHDAIVVTPLAIDIKPGSDPNPVNLKSKGAIPVAVMCNDEVDPSEIDETTVVFAGATPVKARFEDLNGDSCDDLVMHFNTEELLLQVDSTYADLSGFTHEGDPVRGRDSVKIVPAKQGGKKK